MWDSTESPSQALTQLCASSKVSLEDDFIKLHPRSSIEGLKDFKQESTFVVKVTIKHVLDHDDWWYTTCICNKAVYPDSKMFFCEKCNKHVIKVTPRYKLKLHVIDATDSTTFVVFDRDASAMLKKSCSDILDLQDKNTAAGDLPKEFEVLIDKTYLFKVECKNDYNSKFEQSFRVKKVCMDEKVIESFSDVEIKSLDLLIKFTKESNDVETLSDDLNNIVSSHVPPEESLKTKNVIDVQIHELTRKESSQLDNLDLATQPPVPKLKRQSQSMVQENKKIPEFGHVDPIFLAIFGEELGSVWQLEDIEGNQHQLTFNMDVNHPVLTDGWYSDLQSDFADYVRKRRLRRLELQGRHNTFIVQCKLLLCNTPKKSSNIGKGWKDFCTFNRLEEGDILVFLADKEMKKCAYIY
ncbi:uncharacterized protein LOC114188287 [Vigna unguiculata]|uniref:uncharacterized protein LOC114188287 n=1 Tax=Vigna unguiculata TaxID=3917 RepID=UPI001015F44B|nr:uncharacterized protein LOC114188287 [Vigna unguiculata]